MRRTYLVSIWMTLILLAQCVAGWILPLCAGAECADEVCPIPLVDENDQPVYAIVSPVGYHAVEMISQAPRLDTLHGKRIALVGGSFMASVTHEELRQCILAAYPDAEVYMFSEVGSAGPYSVFGQSAQTVAFQDRLQTLGIDAVIAGNCGCGLCTTKESGSAIAAEYIGIPAVTVGAPTFIAQIHSTGINRGVPVLRTAEYPGAFASESEEDLHRKTREVVWPQVEQALTRPVGAEEIALYARDGKRPFDETVYTGNYDEVQEFCQVNGWTDGLPVVPPTDSAVRAYLRFTPYAPDEILGIYPVAYRECTVYTVAVNAVMAGVPKELMPVCIALAQCMNDGEWRRPLASTHGWTPYAWLNGPVARQLGIDCGQGMISETKNKALGRFMDLMMLNLGGYYVKENRMGTFGYLTPFVFAENEEACWAVGWDPYHVDRGYPVNSSTVTAASALAWGNNVTPATDDPGQIMELMAFDITEKQQNGLGNTNPQVYRTLLVTQPVARDLSSGYHDKEELEDDLIRTARRPLFMRAYAAYWANTGSTQSDRYTLDEYCSRIRQDPQEQAALTPVPEWLRGVTDQPELETIATMQKGQTAILIAGDDARNKFMTLPGGGYVTMEIRLPQDWDALLAPMGYEPLAHFFLEETQGTPAQPAADHTPAQPAMEPDALEQLAPILAPEGMTDGEYRIVPSQEQMTGEGRILLGRSDTAAAWCYSAAAAENLPDQPAFMDLLKVLYPGCSLTVSGGQVTGVTLRPQPAGNRNSGSAVGLSENMTAGMKVSVAVVQRQSKSEGKATADGASLTISARVNCFDVALGGTPVADRHNTPGFLRLDGDRVTLDPRMEIGASAKIGVSAGGTWRTLTFTRKDRQTITIEYHLSDSLEP